MIILICLALKCHVGRKCQTQWFSRWWVTKIIFSLNSTEGSELTCLYIKNYFFLIFFCLPAAAGGLFTNFDLNCFHLFASQLQLLVIVQLFSMCMVWLDTLDYRTYFLETIRIWRIEKETVEENPLWFNVW